MPVNRAAQRATGLVRTAPRLPLRDRKIVVVTPSMLASADIKLTQIGQHRQSRTGLVLSLRKAKPGGQNRPEFLDYRAEAGSTWTPGPMVEDTATFLT